MASAIAFSDNIYAIKTHLFLLKAQIPKCLKRQELQETHFRVNV